MAETALDLAHADMQAHPDDDAARLRFYERFADAELFLLLEAEADGDAVTPLLFDVENVQLALVFDRELRLAEFVGAGAPYVVLSGRVLVEMVAGQGLGLALNLDVAPSATIIEPQTVEWLRETLMHRPDEIQALAQELTPPNGLPEALVKALDTKLSLATGLASSAYLAGVLYDDGRRGHLLAFVDALADAERALALAVNEALTFSGIEAGALDVAFFRASDPISARLARVALRFDIPKPQEATQIAPGMNPDVPPRLS
jgi:hypothetical protein